MVDITHKNTTLREATAEAVVKVSSQATIDALVANQIPKGNVFEMAKTAGLFAVKNTHNSIPDCHPLPIEYANVEYSIQDLNVMVTMTVKTVYKTGVEVEAMHGVSIIALTMYDMLKPVDKGIEIKNIRLVRKKGGKSSFKIHSKDIKAAVIVCSDSVSAGKKEDRAGKAVIASLEKQGVQVTQYDIIPDQIAGIQQKVKDYVSHHQLVIFTGGTGLSKTDVTPEALEPMLERRIPGVEEAIRSYGQDRMPYAMLSRSIAGTIGDTIVLGLPGSTKGAAESMAAIFPSILHVFDVLKAFEHRANE